MGRHRVRSVASNILKESIYISPVDMLIKIGVLSERYMLSTQKISPAIKEFNEKTEKIHF